MDQRLRLVLDMQNNASAELRKLSKDFAGVKPTTGMKNTASWFQTLEGASISANKALRPLAGGLGTIGVSGLAAGLSVAGLIGQFRDLAKALPALQELSRQTGISKTELERLKATAANLDIDPSKMTAAISYFSREMVEFSKGSGQLYGEMQNGASGLARKIASEWKEHPEQALKDYLGWLTEIPAANKAAGKSLQEGVQIQRNWAGKGLGDEDMAQVVGKGMGGFQEAYSQAARDVHEITDETVEAAAKFDRSIASFDRTWKDFETTVGPFVFQNLTRATDNFRDTFETIKDTVTWFDKHKNHLVESAAEVARNAIHNQAEENKRNPKGIIFDVPGWTDRAISAVTGAGQGPIAPPAVRQLYTAPAIEEDRATRARDIGEAPRASTAPPPAYQTPAAYDREMRARQSDALDGFVLGSLDKPVTHLIGTLKTAAAAVDGNLRPAAFHPAGGAGLTAALDPEATIAAGTRRGFIEAFREIQGTQNPDGGSGFTPTAFHMGGVPGGRSAAAAGDRPGTPNMRYGRGGRTPGSDAYPGQGGTDDTGGAGATSGMRARNLGNIGYFHQHDAGLIGPSNSRDVDHSIALYATQEDGIRAAARLALHKYQSGMHNTAALIAGKGGWTPGALGPGASVNVAKAMGLSNQDDLHLDDPAQMRKFLHGLAIQEHGKAGAYYTPEMIDRALSGKGATTATGPEAAAGPHGTYPDWMDSKSRREMAGINSPLARDLIQASAETGAHFRILQGLRTQDEANANARKGTGVRNSQHLYGAAADLKLTGADGRDLDRNDPAYDRYATAFERISRTHGGSGRWLGHVPGWAWDRAHFDQGIGYGQSHQRDPFGAGGPTAADVAAGNREIFSGPDNPFLRAAKPLGEAADRLKAVVAPMPAVTPEPQRLDATGGQRVQVDPINLTIRHHPSGHTSVAARAGAGVKVDLQTAPTMVRTA